MAKIRKFREGNKATISVNNEYKINPLALKIDYDNNKELWFSLSGLDESKREEFFNIASDMVNQAASTGGDINLSTYKYSDDNYKHLNTKGTDNNIINIVSGIFQDRAKSVRLYQNAEVRQADFTPEQLDMIKKDSVTKQFSYSGKDFRSLLTPVYNNKKQYLTQYDTQEKRNQYIASEIDKSIETLNSTDFNTYFKWDNKSMSKEEYIQKLTSISEKLKNNNLTDIKSDLASIDSSGILFNLLNSEGKAKDGTYNLKTPTESSTVKTEFTQDDVNAFLVKSRERYKDISDPTKLKSLLFKDFFYHLNGKEIGVEDDTMNQYILNYDEMSDEAKAQIDKFYEYYIATSPAVSQQPTKSVNRTEGVENTDSNFVNDTIDTTAKEIAKPLRDNTYPFDKDALTEDQKKILEEMLKKPVLRYNRDYEAKPIFDIITQNMSGDEKVRAVASIADLAGAIVSFVPGASIASAGIGAGATLTNAITDLAMGRNVGDTLVEGGVNLALDIFSVIPGLKAAKIMKNMDKILDAVTWAKKAIEKYRKVAGDKAPISFFGTVISAGAALQALWEFSDEVTKNGFSVGAIQNLSKSLTGAKTLKNFKESKEVYIPTFRRADGGKLQAGGTMTVPTMNVGNKPFPSQDRSKFVNKSLILKDIEAIKKADPNADIAKIYNSIQDSYNTVSNRLPKDSPYGIDSTSGTKDHQALFKKYFYNTDQSIRQLQISENPVPEAEGQVNVDNMFGQRTQNRYLDFSDLTPEQREELNQELTYRYGLKIVNIDEESPNYEYVPGTAKHRLVKATPKTVAPPEPIKPTAPEQGQYEHTATKPIYKNKYAVNIPTSLLFDTAAFATLLFGNKNNPYQAVKLQSPRVTAHLMDDNVTQSLYNRQAAKIQTATASPITSDASMQLANMLAGKVQADELIDKGRVATKQEFDKTSAMVKQAEDNNIYNSTQIANQNLQNWQAINNENIQMRNAERQAKVQNIYNYLRDKTVQFRAYEAEMAQYGKELEKMKYDKAISDLQARPEFSILSDSEAVSLSANASSIYNSYMAIEGDNNRDLTKLNAIIEDTKDKTDELSVNLHKQAVANKAIVEQYEKLNRYNLANSLYRYKADQIDAEFYGSHIPYTQQGHGLPSIQRVRNYNK